MKTAGIVRKVDELGLPISAMLVGDIGRLYMRVAKAVAG